MTECIRQKSELRVRRVWFDQDRLVSRTVRESWIEWFSAKDLGRFSGSSGEKVGDSEHPARSTHCFRHCRPSCFVWLVLREPLTPNQIVNMMQRPITEVATPNTKLKSW